MQPRAPAVGASLVRGKCEISLLLARTSGRHQRAEEVAGLLSLGPAAGPAPGVLWPIRTSSPVDNHLKVSSSICSGAGAYTWVYMWGAYHCYVADSELDLVSSRKVVQLLNQTQKVLRINKRQ